MHADERGCSAWVAGRGSRVWSWVIDCQNCAAGRIVVRHCELQIGAHRCRSFAGIWPRLIEQGERAADAAPRQTIQPLAICVFCAHRLPYLR
jgi:hypothetical protein